MLILGGSLHPPVTDLTIRRFRDADRDRVRDLHEAALRDAGDYADVPDADLDDVESSYLDEGDFLVGTVDGDVVAMGAYRPASDWHAAQFADLRRPAAVCKRLRVDPAHQRQGHGTAMLDELERRAALDGIREMVLDVSRDRTGARRFYAAAGYDPAGDVTVETAERTFDLALYRKRLDRDGAAVRTHYDRLAPDWADIVQGEDRDDAWDVVIDLLPPVDGSRVLDAGCGSGVYSARLARLGADVLGVDFSPEMLAQARRRHGDSATFRETDLRTGLDGVEADAFDAVLCQHVFSHLPDLDPATEAFARVLAPEGTLTLSIHHPFFYYRAAQRERFPDVETPTGDTLSPTLRTDAAEATYGDTERIEITWGGDSPAVYYRRPLSAVVESLRTAGFVVEAVREPQVDAGETLLDSLPEALFLRARLD